ncbi:unnamed protein product [Paramecium primaurelia]|uniref:Ada DNA repair metal-binding domain-containing protein n=1 Tax=Paramecium primaurelia TaxID=5886 RepID=A0A8S1NT88_PARPR|nr:unnamed protein product [Paramecium primaurelia]
MIEELKEYFQDYLEKKFEKISNKLQDLQQQFFQHKKELEINIIEHKEKMFTNYQKLENQFQSLLKDINITQKQADEIIEKISKKLVPNCNPQQQQIPFIQSVYPSQVQSTIQSNINLKDFNNNNFYDYSHKTADKTIENIATQSIAHLKVSNFDKGQNIVFITKSGIKYHNAQCDYLNNSKIPLTIREALKRGFTSCQRCIG